MPEPINPFETNTTIHGSIPGEWEDVSAQVYGKYQHCTMYRGKWYADSDFTQGHGFGRPKFGSIPSPMSIDQEPFTFWRWITGR